MAKNGKLIIASLRLPVRVNKKNGKLVYRQSDGGLATGVSYVSKSSDSVWVGWPGIASDELTQKEKDEITKELKQRGCHPIFLTQKQVDNYYSGYCNATIWPLFHYFTNMSVHDTDYWDEYKVANLLFSKEIGKLLTSEHQVWIHDYQLMLVPTQLRARHPSAQIGFFLHTTFPSFEIFRLLPEREELLRGLLGADLIGFHTYDYVRHFLSSVQRVLGYESHLGAIKTEDRTIQTDAFPIGIDYKKFAKSSKARAVKKMVNSFALHKEKTKVILAVDRADYSKGIPARLDAYELFLKNNPDYHNKVVLVLLAAPSRENVEAYQDLREDIEQKVSRINGKFSTVDWSPITYFHKSLPLSEVSALYAMADVMLVTPLRDGMNLVAKEFVATKHKQGGVLVLSEMAGVASELPEALQVNPNNTEMVAGAIVQALSMSLAEQKERMKAMQGRISQYTIGKWAEDFLTQLTKSKTKTNGVKLLTSKNKKQLINEYKSAEKRLILLDYDGTLKEFVSTPSAILARPSVKLAKILKKLTKDPKNNVTIVSGRPKNTLASFFDDTALNLIAEHGGWILNAGKWVSSSLASKKWKKGVMEIVNAYVERTPGAVVEEKDFSIAWHFRRVSPDLAYVRAEQLKMELQSALSDVEIGVFEGNKLIEIKPQRMNKGAIASELMADEQWDFIMTIGDDYTDEDMFAVMPERSYSIKVGSAETKAKYQLPDVPSVVELIKELSEL